MPSTTDSITEQLAELQTKALAFVADIQAPVVEQVSKVAETVGPRLPEQAKQAIVSQVEFVTSVLDAIVKPLRPVAPVAKAKTVKAA